MSRFKLLSAIALACVAAAVACGGGTSTPNTSTPAATAPATPATASAGASKMPDQTTLIHLTQNSELKSGRTSMPVLNSVCAATVSTHAMLVKRSQTIEWTIKEDNGAGMHGCIVDYHMPQHPVGSDVVLAFTDNIFDSQTSAPQACPLNGKMYYCLTGTGTGRGNDMKITAQITSDPNVAPQYSEHKYMVLYKQVLAGPDPVIVIDCDGCLPGGGAPAQPGASQ